MGRRRLKTDPALARKMAEYKAEKLAALIEVYEEVWSQVRPQLFTIDCCIAAVAIGVRVFRHFGFYAQPLPVKAVAMNRSWFERVYEPYMAGEHAEPQLPSEDEMARDGLYAVGVGFQGGVCAATGDDTGWDGHLVMMVERKLLIDPSASQLGREAFGMGVPQVVVVSDLGPAWKRGGAIVESPETDAIIHYSPDRANTSYVSSHDWKAKAQNDHIARRLIREIDG